MDWSKYDSKVDIEGLKNDVKESDGNQKFERVPDGKYEVKLFKLELTKSKKGKPMVSFGFEVINGEYNKRRIYLFQLVEQGWQIKRVNDLLESLNTDYEIEFNGYADYNDLILDVAEQAAEFEFVIDYGTTKNGFDTLEVVEVFKK